MSKYSFETTVGEMLDTPETKALLEEICPQVLEHPLLEVGRTFKFVDALPYVQDMIDESTVEEFKKRLEAL
ncbi:MAG: hypothetical protein GYA50_04930 [Eubacteriaceae bacterium]|nr:hypothetical protein [Eubacteriaceae bacterium]